MRRPVERKRCCTAKSLVVVRLRAAEVHVIQRAGSGVLPACNRRGIASRVFFVIGCRGMVSNVVVDR